MIKIIDSKRWNLYFSFHAANADEIHLIRLDDLISGAIRDHSLRRHRSIFIHFVHGTISSSYFTNRERFRSSFVRIQIEPQITYFGGGEGISRSSFVGDEYLPKFLVSHVKSKEDIKTRIELVLNWIGQQQQMFADIGTVFQG